MAHPELMPAVGGGVDGAIARAIGELVRVRTSALRTEIALPVLYPNGSHVAVFVYPDGDAFTVSDEGRGAAEADMAGVDPGTFATIARREAGRVGATSDGHAILIPRVTVDKLAIAITVLADLSRNAVAGALDRLAAKARTAPEVLLLGRLEHTFGAPNVEANADVYGASNVLHRVVACVTVTSRPVLFDFFTDHRNSFNAAVAKFFDISQRDDAPARVGVTPKQSELGDRLALISSVATVIDVDAVEDAFLRAAA